MSKDCALCQIIARDPSSHKTEWFYAGWDGTVVEDDNPGTLLYIPNEHVAKYYDLELDHARRLLWGIACALEIQRGYTIGGFEIIEGEHWHAKLSLHKGNQKLHYEIYGK